MCGPFYAEMSPKKMLTILLFCCFSGPTPSCTTRPTLTYKIPAIKQQGDITDMFL